MSINRNPVMFGDPSGSVNAVPMYLFNRMYTPEQSE